MSKKKPLGAKLPRKKFATNVLYNKNSHTAEDVPNGAAQLVFCSPPYNVDKGDGVKRYDQHNDALEWGEYLKFLERGWRWSKRKLCVGGRLVIVVADTGRKPYIPLHSYITLQCIKLGYLMRGTIIWDKGAGAGSSTAWGSFARASNPILRDTHEYMLVFSKGAYKLEREYTNGEASGISNADFVERTRSVWHKRTATRSAKIDGVRIKHPAPFSLDLAASVIEFYTNKGDLVIDNYAGSCTTGEAAALLGRRYVCYDLSADYLKLGAHFIAAAERERERRLEELRREAGVVLKAGNLKQLALV